MVVTVKKYCPPPIPEGYSTLSDAHKRIRDKWGWGNPDGLRRFISYLSQGTLPIYQSDQSGVRPCCKPKIWADPQTRKYLSDPDDLYSGWKMLSSTSELLFKTSELDAVFPPVEQQAEQDRSPQKVPVASGSSEQTPKPKGRPPNVGSDDFWIEAGRLANEGKQGRPDQTQEEFIAAMMAWCFAKMATPYSEDTVREKIEKLWRRWELGGKGGRN